MTMLRKWVIDEKTGRRKQILVPVVDGKATSPVQPAQTGGKP